MGENLIPNGRETKINFWNYICNLFQFVSGTSKINSQGGVVYKTAQLQISFGVLSPSEMFSRFHDIIVFFFVSHHTAGEN